MEFRPSTKDKRIPISSYLTEKGITETFPLNSFTFQCFLEQNQTPVFVYTTETETPNNYITSLQTSEKKRNRLLIAAKKEGFFLYDTTFLLEKNQNQITHLYNSKRNLRWTLIQTVTTEIKALNIYPAAVWPEREIKDMFNIKTSKLKDTRRLLLDYKTPKGVLNKNNKKTIKPYYSSINGLYYG